MQGSTNFDGYQGSLLALPDPSADFDMDDYVDGADFLRWQRGFGTLGGAIKLQGDSDDDGDVDSEDLSIWEGQFGTTPPRSSAITVPESSAVVLFALTALGLMNLRCPHSN